MEKEYDSQLTWGSTLAVVRALMESYPEADRLGLSLQDVQHHVQSLKGFSSTTLPDENTLKHILWTWMRVAENPSEGYGA